MRGCIMVFADEAALRDVVYDRLTSEGYTVLTYACAVEGFVEVMRRLPDLIILDYLPGEEPHGLLLWRQLAAEPSMARIPVILCTATGVDDDLAANARRPRVRLLQKPFTVDDLLANVDALLPSPTDTGTTRAGMAGTSRAPQPITR